MKMWNGCLEATARKGRQGGDKAFLVAKGCDRGACTLVGDVIEVLGCLLEVFSTWMAFGGNTHDLGLFGEEMDEITDLHQILEEVLLTERGDSFESIKRRRRDLFSDGV
ncbi:hypothetical protein Tco_0502125 [Tanacetum coccineum]